MDNSLKFLLPEKFDADPDGERASLEWDHWYTTFNNFTEKAKVEDGDKLNILYNYITSKVFDYISGSKTFDSAIKILKATYNKPTNRTRARHLLSMRQQNRNESLEEYFNVLQNLSFNCDFRTVSAKENRDAAILSAFINGVNSNHIRGYLIEKNKMDLNKAYDAAQSMAGGNKHPDENARVRADIFEGRAPYQTFNKMHIGPSGMVSKFGKDTESGNSHHKFYMNVKCYRCQKIGHSSKTCNVKLG